jgi:hypothetical protein
MDGMDPPPGMDGDMAPPPPGEDMPPPGMMDDMPPPGMDGDMPPPDPMMTPPSDDFGGDGPGGAQPDDGMSALDSHMDDAGAHHAPDMPDEIPASDDMGDVGGAVVDGPPEDEIV